jgi:hypothetical protein
MEPILLPNPQRGCGQLKTGGTYLQSGPASTTGSLRRLTWLLDWCITDAPEVQFTVAVPPRAIMQIDPLASILTRSLIPAGGMVGPLPQADDQAHLNQLGRFGLADHVGESFYTPWSFAMELAEHGPSRRVPHDIAKEVAKHLPCPILFFMPLPIVGKEVDAVEWLAGLNLDAADFAFRPTWDDPQWSFLTRAYDGGPRLDTHDGSDHFEVRVLAEADRLGKAAYDAFGIWTEMPFCLSVITKAVYVLGDGEDDLPEHLQDSGVLPGRIEE